MHLASLLHATACMSLRSRWLWFSHLMALYSEAYVIVTRKWLRGGRWDVDFDNLVTFDPKMLDSCPPSPAHVNNSGRRTLLEFLRDILCCRNSADRRHKHHNANAKLGVIYGVSQEEKEALKRSHNACHTVLCWLTSTVARRYKTVQLTTCNPKIGLNAPTARS